MANGRNCRICWSLLIVVILAVGAGAYRLLSGGHTHTAGDGREEIVLEAEERDLVLAEMRTFLSAVQGITIALTQDDLQAVAQHARTVGAAAVGQIPAGLMQALPLEFKTLGRDVHTDFDQLALDAEQLGNRDHALRQLGDILGQCVACHARYRFSVGSSAYAPSAHVPGASHE